LWNQVRERENEQRARLKEIQRNREMAKRRDERAKEVRASQTAQMQFRAQQVAQRRKKAG
jgi:hypothetical protein